MVWGDGRSGAGDFALNILALFLPSAAVTARTMSLSTKASGTSKWAWTNYGLSSRVLSS
jgi:hypothetical protein